MLGHNYFHRAIIRKHTAAFGSLFTDIYIKDWDDTDNSWKEEVRVPVSYGSKEKHLSRVNIREHANEAAAITLPRISFVITNVSYDSARALNKRNKYLFDSESNTKKSLRTVPYNITFELAILAKKAEDATKIIEQIVPFFQPEFNVTIKFPFEGDESLESAETLSIDVPIVLEDVSTEDTYDGDFETRRAITWTLNFTMKTWFFGPTSSSKIIKKTIIDFTEQDYRIEGIPVVEGKTLDEIIDTDDWAYTTNITEIDE